MTAMRIARVFRSPSLAPWTVCEPAGARRVVPIHWDNFTVPLDKPLRPLPSFADDFGSAMEFLSRRAATAGVILALPVPGRGPDPFAPAP